MRASRVLALCLACFSFVATAQAAAIEPAKLRDTAALQHFRLGVQAFDAGDWEVARIEFQTAYDLSKLGDLLHNLSEVAERAARIDEAIRLEQAFLDSTEVNQDDRATALARITRLRLAARAQRAPSLQPPSTARRLLPIIGLGVGIGLIAGSVAVLATGQAVKNRIESEPVTLGDYQAAQANAPVYLGFTLGLAGSGAIITGLSAVGIVKARQR